MILTAEIAEDTEGTEFISFSAFFAPSAVFFFSTQMDGSGF